MKLTQWTLALLLMAGLIITGCGGEQASAPEAPVETLAAPAEPAPAEEAPAEEAPAPAAEAPAADAGGDEWDDLEIGSISGSQDLGLDMEEEAPAAEPAPVEAAAAEDKPAEQAPAAAAAGGDEWDDLEIGSISGSQDLGLDMEEEAPATEPAPVEAAAAEDKPAEQAPAAAAGGDDEWDDLEIGSISGSQDIGLDMEEDAPAEAAAAAPAEAAATDAGTATTYTVAANDDSALFWTGYKPTGARQGGFNKFEGTATVAGSDFTTLAVDLTVDVTSLYSDAGGVQEALISKDFLNPEAFPTAKFVSTKVEKDGDSYNVTGDFTFLAVTKAITIPCEIALQGDSFYATGEVTINRRDWGMKAQTWIGSGKDTLIKDNVDIGFEVLCPKQ